MYLKVATASALARRNTLLLIACTIALSAALLLGVNKIRTDVRESFARSVSGVDLIVGARGGDLQLLLYSVFHIGQATRNIRWESVEKIRNHPQVAWAHPVLLGDSHKGYRVVGTDAALFDNLQIGRAEALSFAQGQAFANLYDVVLGAEVARALGYRLGDELTLSHGLGRTSFSEHDDKPFKVVGVLAATGGPLDRSLLVSGEAITAIHIGWESGVRLPGAVDHAHAAEQDLTPKDATALLVKMKSKLATFHVQRQINQYAKEPLQAVLPGVALQQLWELISVVENALLLVASCVALVGLIGMLSVLLTSLSARQWELTIFRMLGMRPWHMMTMLCCESLLVTLFGIVLGVAIYWGGLLLLADHLQTYYGLFLDLQQVLDADALKLLSIMALAGLLTGFWPGWRAYVLSGSRQQR